MTKLTELYHHNIQTYTKNKWGFPERGVPPKHPIQEDVPLQTIQLLGYPHFRAPPCAKKCNTHNLVHATLGRFASRTAAVLGACPPSFFSRETSSCPRAGSLSPPFPWL